ncbi:hypothetical protein MNV49_003065 [Pseudohyphozyma bogoriensis]|nr:hypothetical protein MNV49_003065 [Pseudohyphozyma bogoriensis]
MYVQLLADVISHKLTALTATAASGPESSTPDNLLDPSFLDSLLGFTTSSALLKQPLDPCEVVYPDPKQRRLMRLFVGEAERLLVNVSPQPHQVTFLDLSQILWFPAMGLSADALRLSLLAIGALTDAWTAGRNDKKLLTKMVGVAKNMNDAAAGCLTTAMALAEPEEGVIDEAAFYAATMLSVCGVLSGVNGSRKPFDTAFQLVNDWGGPNSILESVRFNNNYGSIRKVLEFIAVMDVLDALASARCPKYLTSPEEASWCMETLRTGSVPQSPFTSLPTNLPPDLKVVDLVAQVKSGTVYSQDTPALPPVHEDFTATLLRMNAHASGELLTSDSLSQAALLDKELDLWPSKEEEEAPVPRARHGNRASYMFDCASAALVLQQAWAQTDGGTDVDVTVIVQKLGVVFL